MTRLLKILSTLFIAGAVTFGAPLAATAATATPIVGVPVGQAEAGGVAGGVRAAVAADTSDFTFSGFAAEYYLGRDEAGHSTLRTEEMFVAEFPEFDQNRGIVRAIPNNYDGVPLHTAVESVTDGAGTPVNFESTTVDGFTELALGTDEFVRGTQVYVISYSQQNVVRAFADTANDEFYWDTNGTGFDQPFGAVAARVHVDAAVAPNLTGSAACYTGAQGDSGACEIEQTADAEAADPSAQLFTAEAVDLGPRENLTLAIGFEAGTFLQVPAEAQPAQPGYGGSSSGATNLSDVFGTMVGVIAGLVGLGIAAPIAWLAFRPRSPKSRRAIIPQYSVPAGYNLLEAADLIGRTRAAMAAQIVSFAVRGNVRILDYPVTASGADFTLQLLSADDVDNQERAVLGVFFPGLAVGALCELGVTNDAVATQLAAATTDAHRRTSARGWRARAPWTPRKKGWTIGSASVLAAAVAVLLTELVAGAVLPGNWAWPAFLVGGLALIGVCVAAARPVLLTPAGVEQRDYLEGMKVYLELAEADRFRLLQSPDGALRATVPQAVPGQANAAPASAADTVELVKLYEKLLPFAVLWGIEKEWAAELAVHYDQDALQPDWFVSQNTFNGMMLGSVMNGLIGSVRTTQTPTPPPPSPTSWTGSGGGSFSGGSFGGGFSGGGGGGGGGGGR